MAGAMRPGEEKSPPDPACLHPSHSNRMTHRPNAHRWPREPSPPGASYPGDKPQEHPMKGALAWLIGIPIPIIIILYLLDVF